MMGFSTPKTLIFLAGLAVFLQGCFTKTVEFKLPDKVDLPIARDKIPFTDIKYLAGEITFDPADKIYVFANPDGDPLVAKPTAQTKIKASFRTEPKLSSAGEKTVVIPGLNRLSIELSEPLELIYEHKRARLKSLELKSDLKTIKAKVRVNLFNVWAWKSSKKYEEPETFTGSETVTLDSIRFAGAYTVEVSDLKRELKAQPVVTIKSGKLTRSFSAGALTPKEVFDLTLPNLTIHLGDVPQILDDFLDNKNFLLEECDDLYWKGGTRFTTVDPLSSKVHLSTKLKYGKKMCTDMGETKLLSLTRRAKYTVQLPYEDGAFKAKVKVNSVSGIPNSILRFFEDDLYQSTTLISKEDLEKWGVTIDGYGIYPKGENGLDVGLSLGYKYSRPVIQ